MNFQKPPEEKEDLEALENKLDYASFLGMLKDTNNIPLMIGIISNYPNGCFRSGQSKDLIIRFLEKFKYSFQLKNIYTPEKRELYNTALIEINQLGINARIKLYEFCKFVQENTD